MSRCVYQELKKWQSRKVKQDGIDSFQRWIRERRRALEPYPVDSSLAGAVVRQIARLDAEKIILEYEWLKTIGRAIACYGLFLSNDLVGAVAFGWPAGAASRDICGQELRKVAVCLERGACVHWAPRYAASFLISRATRMASLQFGRKIFYAYADEDAGEIGVIYQACNWFYLGQGIGRDPGRKREDFLTPEGAIVSGRTLRRRGLTKRGVLGLGWQVIYSSAKHKYVWFEGNSRERRELISRCRYPFLKYPKRLRDDLSNTLMG